MTTSPLLTKLTEYQAWRSDFNRTITDFRDWLTNSPQTDSIKELRLFDMVELLKRDQMVVAFLAEDGRGKTETINALFFADYNLRLLPSETGKHTKCSTEIFWDAKEEPSIKLLPITTRKSEDTLTYLKTTPNIWEKFRLNIYSAEEMKATFNKLTEQIEVTQAEAEELGLWQSGDARVKDAEIKTGLIKVPAWRHALINLPHPILKTGLVIVDAPSINKISAEPELLLSIIPNAHAVMFLTATDVGVSDQDLEIWNEYIKYRTRNKLVVLNKIDLLWDNQKSKQSIVNTIERQVNITAHQLNVAPEAVFPISAESGLIAKVKKDNSLLVESKLNELEVALGSQLIKVKHELLGRTIAKECSDIIKSSRKVVQHRLSSLRAQITELKALRGQNLDESKHILAKIVTQRKRYEATIPTFNLANEKISNRGKKLTKHLSVEYSNKLLAKSRQDIGESWTTVGLNRGMRNLIKQANELAITVDKESKTIKRLAENVYHVFQVKHGFETFEPPELNMNKFLTGMLELEKITDDFCRDPINVLTEKHFLIRKFYLGLGALQKKIFQEAFDDCEHWLNNVLSTLKSQMAEHKASLDERTRNLMKAKDSAEALDKQLSEIEREHALLVKESQTLDTMLLHMVTIAQPAIKAQNAAKNNHGFDKSLQMPELSFLSMSGNG